MEEWRPIAGYEGRYEISNLGRVRSLNYGCTGQTQMLRPQMFRRGYLFVHLYKEGKPKLYYVHRLVAQAFIPNQENKPCIDHINGDKGNNSIENLRWCTYKENMNNPITRVKMSVGSHSEKQKKALAKTHTLLKKAINQYTLSNDFLKTWESGADIKRETGYNNQRIMLVCQNKAKTAYGFIWKYAE